MDTYKKALTEFIYSHLLWAGYSIAEGLPTDVVETLLASGLTPAEVQDLYEEMEEL